MDKDLPKYLFKILSIENWKSSDASKVKLAAEDDSFIHLSRDDQLDKIIDKFWANVQQFVVLKIDSSKLPGKLVFETNPGGLNKYYHLYGGWIPLSSILETRLIDRTIQKKGENLSLKIVQIGDPVLRTLARKLSKDEILSQEIQDLISAMKNTMRNAPGVGLAAPQIGRSIQLIVIEDREEYHKFLTAEQLVERARLPVAFHVIINPVLHLDETEQAEFFEGCLSVPSLFGVVPRAKKVRVECLNEKGQPVTIHAAGWYARILQHEIDHVQGTMFIDRAYTRTLSTAENFTTWKNKPIMEVKKELNC